MIENYFILLVYLTGLIGVLVLAELVAKIFGWDTDD